MQCRRNMVAFLCDHYCTTYKKSWIGEKEGKKIVTCNIPVIKRRTVYIQARNPCHLFLMDQWFYSWINIGYVLDAGKNTPISIEKRLNQIGFLFYSYWLKYETSEIVIFVWSFVCFDDFFVFSYELRVGWSGRASSSAALVWIMANSVNIFWMNRQYLTETPLI